MSNPTLPFETQNVHDDDGQVIDSFFVETDAPPNLKDATDVVASPAVEQPKKITRIISRQDLIQPGWDPVMLFPADASRKHVCISVYSPTTVATDGIRVFSDKGNLRNAGIVLHNQGPMSDMLVGHTGEVYVIAAALGDPGTPASAPVWVFAWSVTE